MATQEQRAGSISTSDGGKEQGLPAAAAAPQQKRVCGLKRGVFWLLAALVAACVVVGVVVGAVIGTRNARHSSSSSASSTSSTSYTTNAVPMNATLRSLAASTALGATSDAENATLQIFYQDLNTTAILYRLVWDDAAQAEQTVNLTITPKEATPIAATAANSTDAAGGLDVNVFYLTLSNTTSNGTAICQATLYCAQDAASCSTTYNAVISANVTDGPRSDSGLAAVQLADEDGTQLRVFFHSDASQPTLLYGDDPLANGWTSTGAGGSSTPDNSSISANLVVGGGADGNSDVIDLFFVNSNTGDPREEQYADAVGIQGANTNRTTITDTTGAGFEATSKFATVYAYGLSTYYFFYAQSGGALAGWQRGSGSNDTWAQYTDASWATSDGGGVAAVTWGGEVRLVYMVDGALAVSALTDDAWAEVESI